MDLNLISDIDLETLEEELNSERLSFRDVANYVSELPISDNYIEQVDNLKDHCEQILKLIKISQVLLRYAIEKLPKEESNERYVFQCTNCSKAFRKSEYLENHIQRRHSTKSLAENGLYPLIEQIKRYNTGLFVESSSIDNLKIEIKNLHTCLKETSEDLIKEKTAREQLPSIIESEIIEKLNLLQETWSEARDENRTDDNARRIVDLTENSNEQAVLLSEHQLERQKESHLFLNDVTQMYASPNTKESGDFNLFLIKQNELIDKLGQNIDRFVERNDESKLNDKQLQTFISSTIHKEIKNLLMVSDRKEDLESKEANSSKKTNSRQFSMNSRDKDTVKSGVDEQRRESLHEFSIQNHLNYASRTKDHTDDIVHEINRMIGDETLTAKNQIKAPSFKSKIRKFPFKFRKSKSSIQLSGEEMSSKVENGCKDEKLGKNSVANDLQKEDDRTTMNGDDKNESHSSEKLKDTKNEIEKVNDKPAISRFRQFVWKKSDSTDNQDHKISLNKFSTKSKVDETTGIELNENNEKTNDDGTAIKQAANPTISESKTLKSVLKKSNSTDKNLQLSKLPKKSIAFSDERIEFSAEELEDSSDTGSSYSFSGNTNYNALNHQNAIYAADNVMNYSSNTNPLTTTMSNYPVHKLNYIMQPKEQTLSVQKVIERPVPAPRFVQQQSTLTSL